MISVCLATHNGEKYIKTQLESILAQLGQNDEVVISDDGSSDRTLSIIADIQDARLKVFHYKQPDTTKHHHEYVCRNFENALIHAKGDIIFLSDQDDIWKPNKVAVCVKALENSDLVLHEFEHIDSHGSIILNKHYAGEFRYKNYFLRSGLYYGCAMAFRRCVLDYALPFPRHVLIHDYWIGILSESLGRFAFVKEPLIQYRIHGCNTSVTNNSLAFKIGYRMRLLVLVFSRIISYRIRRLFGTVLKET